MSRDFVTDNRNRVKHLIALCFSFAICIFTLTVFEPITAEAAANTVKGKQMIASIAKKTYYCTGKNVKAKAGTDGNNREPDPNPNSNSKITVVKNKVKYDVAQPATGDFVTGQKPSNILCAFEKSEGKSGLNHPNDIATDGTHFVICDTWNNRVLIYNTIPNGGEKPDVVIGQPNFKTFNASNSENGMNWPVSAAFIGKKLLICDTNNYRILVYDKVPTKNGQKPDRIVTLIDENYSTAWPWDIWSDGKKAIVTCTLGGRIAVWNKAEDLAMGKPASFVMTGFGTPRTIVSDGKFLLVGDHNAQINGVNRQGSYVWKNFPTSADSKPDFVLDRQYDGAIIDGDVYLREGANYYIYDGVIDSAKEKPAKEIIVIDTCLGGDTSGILYINGKTYVSCYNSGYVAIFKGKITNKNASKPDALVGAKKAVRSTFVERGIYQNVVPASDGTSLVLADDFNHLIAVYKKIPDSANVRADYEYVFEGNVGMPADVDFDEDGKMYVLTSNSLYVWKKAPVNGEMYDARYTFGVDHEIGTLNAKLTVDSKYIYIASETDKTIFVFKRSAKNFSFSKAVKKIECGTIRDINSNGKYLVVTSQEQSKIDIYKTSDLSLYGTVKGETIGDGLRLHPASALVLPDGRFVVANTGYSVIWVYKNVDTAIADYTNFYAAMGNNDVYRVANYIGNEYPVMEMTGIATRDNMFTPTTLGYKDGHLWVGEFKFSSRLFRYDLSSH